MAREPRFARATRATRATTPQKQALQGFGKGSDGAKYRKDYDMRMGDTEYSHYEDQKSIFEKSIKDFRTSADTKIGKAQKDYDDNYDLFKGQMTTGQKNLKDAYDALGDAPSIEGMFEQWFEQEKIPVHIRDGDTLEATYMVPRSVVESVNETMNKDGSYYGTFNKDFDNYNMDVQVKGGGKRGKELHEMFITELANPDYLMKEFTTNPDVQEGFQEGLSAWGTAQDAVNLAQTEFNNVVGARNTEFQGLMTNIRTAEGERDTAIGRAEAKRKGTLDQRAASYREKSANRQAAFAHLKDMTYE